MSRSKNAPVPRPAVFHRQKLDFEELAYHLDRSPDLLPSPWKKTLDRLTQTALLYQLDLHSAVPSIRKAVRISCIKNPSGGGGPILTPTVFINNQALDQSGSAYVKTITGKENIESLNDLSILLQHLPGENIDDLTPAYKYRPDNNFDDVFEGGSGLPESDTSDLLNSAFPLLSSEFKLKSESKPPQSELGELPSGGFNGNSQDEDVSSAKAAPSRKQHRFPKVSATTRKPKLNLVMNVALRKTKKSHTPLSNWSEYWSEYDTFGQPDEAAIDMSSKKDSHGTKPDIYQPLSVQYCVAAATADASARFDPSPLMEDFTENHANVLAQVKETEKRTKNEVNEQLKKKELVERSRIKSGGEDEEMSSDSDQRGQQSDESNKN